MALRLFPDNTNFDFAGNRYFAFAFDGLLAAIAIVSLFINGLNLGIDFTGGVVIEVSKSEPIDIAALRTTVGGLEFGDVNVQGVDNGLSALIRVQPKDVTDGQQMAAATKIRDALGASYTFNKVDVVGPKVSNELFTSGILATVLAVLMIAVYVAFRFEWQFGIAAVLSTGHDVLMGVGLFSVLQLDFNLTSVAALLLLAGYSINDTVVVFDRIRENRRKFKALPMPQLINLSVNTTLSRTVMTSAATAVSVLPLLFFGGDVLFGFAACILWGIVIGTYSSIFVAGAILLYLPPITIGSGIEPRSAAATS
jgi:preprotein translocase SecF subunit